MEGISKERLSMILVDCLKENISIEAWILRECKELNPWQPIDESTPKDRRIILFFPEYGSYDGGYLMTRRDGSVVFAASASLSVPLGVDATHWQELPDDPT